MIHPISRANSTNAMNPPSNGQYMAGNIYEEGGGTSRRAHVRARREARPARSETGTPRRPGGDAPGGTRTSAGWAGAGRRGARAGRSRTALPPARRRGGCNQRSTSRSSPFPLPAVHSPYVSEPRSCLSLNCRSGDQSGSRPPRATAIPGKRRNFSPAEIPANCGVFEIRGRTRRNFRSFGAR